MTLKSPMRWTMTFGIGIALLAATAATQEAPGGKKGQPQDSAASKPEKQAEAPARPEPMVPATKADTKAANSASSKTGSGAPPVALQNRTDKLSYAFGVSLARDLQRQKNSLNVDLLIRAVTDTLAGNELIMTDDEVTATVRMFEAEQKQDLQHARMMLSERNQKEGEAFFAENAKKDGVVTLPSGLQYRILKKGEGKVPTYEDIVVCNYTGKLLDGTEIDNSYKRKEPTAVPVKGVIPGWTQALQLMPAGSKWQLFVPPQLAYGDKAGGGIPPYATLIFEVELISIQEKAQTASAAK